MRFYAPQYKAVAILFPKAKVVRDEVDRRIAYTAVTQETAVRVQLESHLEPVQNLCHLFTNPRLNNNPYQSNVDPKNINRLQFKKIALNTCWFQLLDSAFLRPRPHHPDSSGLVKIVL